MAFFYKNVLLPLFDTKQFNNSCFSIIGEDTGGIIDNEGMKQHGNISMHHIMRIANCLMKQLFEKLKLREQFPSGL